MDLARGGRRRGSPPRSLPWLYSEGFLLYRMSPSPVSSDRLLSTHNSQPELESSFVGRLRREGPREVERERRRGSGIKTKEKKETQGSSGTEDWMGVEVIREEEKEEKEEILKKEESEL
ncbi:hypothetical protein E2C01_094427 [Portunus trituberculatus]|uniref:Uncharacterized protein n=1 Tax=Portunus trituberculatus TaxID=210409 RepID=A0A5B7JX50_PORTR|nr:hypothetical protein [Portunus trituberculatus]